MIFQTIFAVALIGARFEVDCANISEIPVCNENTEKKVYLETEKQRIYDTCEKENSFFLNDSMRIIMSAICGERSFIKTEWIGFDLKILEIECDIEIGNATCQDLEDEKQRRWIYFQCWEDSENRSDELKCREQKIKSDPLLSPIKACTEIIEKTLKLKNTREKIEDSCMIKRREQSNHKYRRKPFEILICVNKSYRETESEAKEIEILRTLCEEQRKIEIQRGSIIRNASLVDDDGDKKGVVNKKGRVYSECYNNEQR